MQYDPIQMLNLIVHTLYQKKGFNILVLDVRGVSTLTDYFVIAEGTVDRHVVALSRAVTDTLKEQFGVSPIHREGIATGDWAVLDYMQVVIHLFTPDVREMYRLEEVWSAGKIVNFELPDLEKSAVEETIKR